MKKLPKDAEASNILVGELNCLQNPISIFVRLNTALHLGDLTEVPVPTRFIFLLLGPTVRVHSSTNGRYNSTGNMLSIISLEFSFPQNSWEIGLSSICLHYSTVEYCFHRICGKKFPLYCRRIHGNYIFHKICRI